MVPLQPPLLLASAARSIPVAAAADGADVSDIRHLGTRVVNGKPVVCYGFRLRAFAVVVAVLCGHCCSHSCGHRHGREDEGRRGLARTRATKVGPLQASKTKARRLLIS